MIGLWSLGCRKSEGNCAGLVRSIAFQVCRLPKYFGNLQMMSVGIDGSVCGGDSICPHGREGSINWLQKGVLSLKRPIAFVLFLLAILAISCQGPPVNPTATPSSFESPLALPEKEAESPVPTPSPAALAPAEEFPSPTPEIPTPDPQLATVEGTIEMDGEPTGVFPATLYLGDPTGADPIGSFVSLDAETAPRGYVMADGTFVFPNVPPGTYSIVAWTPGGAYIVPDPSTSGQTWLVEVSGNTSFEAGHIFVPAQSAQQ